MVLTALYGIEREGRDFRIPFHSIGETRAAIQEPLAESILMADRVLSPKEYLDWNLKNAPGLLAKMFSGTGVIPMGPAMDEHPSEATPRLGILPIVAIVRGQDLEQFSGNLNRPWPEMTSVAFQRCTFQTFGMIPGYDLLLYLPPGLARSINGAVSSLNRLVEDSFTQAGRIYPGPFDPLQPEIIERIPVREPCPR